MASSWLFKGKRKEPESSAQLAACSRAFAKWQKSSEYGIRELYCSENSIVDILFVHGLAADRIDTWTAQDEPWPKKLLPDEIADCRVLTFGYDASFVGSYGEVSSNRIGNHARNLLNCIAVFRERDNTNDRPLLLVAHCLGGLVCEDALVTASNSPESHFRDVLTAVRGMAFLGTPHHGSDIAPWLEALAKSSKHLQNHDSNMEIISVLKKDSEVLARIQSSFHEMMRGRDNIAFCCFYEELPIAGLKTAVPSHSAIIPGHNYIGIRSDHINMTKFPGKDDEGFKAVSGVLRRWVATIRSQRDRSIRESTILAMRTVDKVTPSLNTEQISQILDSLKFDQMDTRHTTIKSAHPRTCMWILDAPEYQDWLDDSKLEHHHGILWIKGKAGAGKSTLMKFALQEATLTKSMNNWTVVSFFFNARGETLEKSVRGAYQCLLFQLLNEIPQLQMMFNPYNTTSLGKDKPWDVPSLQNWLEKAILRLGKSRVVCYIDALDECDESQIRDMLEFFENVSEQAVSAEIDFRMCFASRFYPKISIAHSIELNLHGQSGHNQDIANYIHAKLNFGSRSSLESLKAEVQLKASGVFMWVVLVVRILQQEYNRGNIHKLRQKLREIPEKLHDLFYTVLTRDSCSLDQMFLSIQWILFARRPMRPEELYCAMLSGSEEWREVLSEKMEPMNNFADTVRDFILASTKDLAEITLSEDPKVQFIHESVKDFLIKEKGLAKIWPSFEACSHDRLKDCCLSYLSNDFHSLLDFPEQLPNYWAVFDQGKATRDAFPFLEYAFQNVLYHADQAQAGNISQKAFLENFPLKTWIKTHNILHTHHANQYTSNVTLLYILAEQNKFNLVRIYPYIWSWLNGVSEQYGNPFLIAAAMRSEEVQRTFLSTLGFKTEYEKEGTQCPDIFCLDKFNDYVSAKFDSSDNKPLAEHLLDMLFVKPWGGAYDEPGKSIRRLLKRLASLLYEHVSSSYNQNKPLNHFPDKPSLEIAKDKGRPDFAAQTDMGCIDWPEWCLLSLAAATDHHDAVRLILSMDHVKPNAKDKSGRTPLLYAVHEGHRETICLLIENDKLNPDLPDELGRTPLSYAAGRGDADVVRALLLAKKALPDQKDKHGRTPLSFAAEKGHEEVVRLLLATNKVDVNSKNWFKGTPLSIAAEKGHQEVVRLLIATNKVEVNSRDQSKRTPLSIAAEKGHQEVVSLLLATSKAAIDSKDNFARTPVSYAAQRGHQEVLLLLLATNKVAIDSKDDFERTPLSYASERGHQGIVRLLVATNRVDLNSKDKEGYTVLSYAARREHQEVVRLLLATNNIDINAKDWRYPKYTPFMKAVLQGNQDIVRLFLETGKVDMQAEDVHGRTVFSDDILRGNQEMRTVLESFDKESQAE